MTFLTVDATDQDTLDANGVGESLNEMFTVGLPRDQCSRLLQLDDKTLDERVARSAIFLAQRDPQISFDGHNDQHFLTLRKGDYHG